MAQRGIKKQIRIALDNCAYTIRGHASLGGHFAGALSGEGFAGGYQAALYDVQAALNGCVNYNSQWWPGSDRGDSITRSREKDANNA